jgi:hypothetical protein
LDLEKCFWTFLDCFGLLWTVLDHYELFWTFLDLAGPFWTSMDFSGLFRTFQDISGHFWTFLDFSGLFWTFLDFPGATGIKYFWNNFPRLFHCSPQTIISQTFFYFIPMLGGQFLQAVQSCTEIHDSS